jgi:hypothetical protein
MYPVAFYRIYGGNNLPFNIFIYLRGCAVEGVILQLYHLLSKKVRLTLHHISSVIHFAFQPTLQASLRRKLPRRHQTSQTTLELIKKNKSSTPSTMDVLLNCMVHLSKSIMKPLPNSSMT